MTLADEDTNSILPDNAKRPIHVAMQVMRPGGQLWKQCKWRHLVAKFVTNARSTNCWPHLQVAPSGGQIYNQCKYRHLGTKIVTIYKLHHLLVKLRSNTTCITSDATFKLISVRKMIPVIESIPWVCFASGNVLVR